MKLYLAGGMSYRELLFWGAIMDLYLAIGGGQFLVNAELRKEFYIVDSK